MDGRHEHIHCRLNVVLQSKIGWSSSKHRRHRVPKSATAVGIRYRRVPPKKFLDRGEIGRLGLRIRSRWIEADLVKQIAVALAGMESGCPQDREPQKILMSGSVRPIHREKNQGRRCVGTDDYVGTL